MPFKVLAMSVNQFMIPSSYSSTLEFVKEDNQIMGIRRIMLDGGEIFTEKTPDR